MKFLLLQSFRLASQATSLYTREAPYRSTVHLKGVTYYTLQARCVKKDRDEKSLSFCDVGADSISARFVCAMFSGAYGMRPYNTLGGMKRDSFSIFAQHF